MSLPRNPVQDCLGRMMDSARKLERKVCLITNEERVALETPNNVTRMVAPTRRSQPADMDDLTDPRISRFRQAV